MKKPRFATFSFRPALAASAFALGASCLAPISTAASENVMLTEVPDYTWHAGCYGTGSGNLMGYWDRHGFPDFYTGPANDGLAPLNSNGVNVGIRSMWTSKAGFDGRPANAFGHLDDYWEYYFDESAMSYESTSPDPYVTAGRPEHEADCIGDFTGLSQRKWTNLNGECDGNIDAFSFIFWEADGNRRTNFVPPPQDGIPTPDVPSGLRAWTQYRGYDCEVFSQLADFNSTVPAGHGFTFEDLKAEINAGYPVLVHLQHPTSLYRFLPGMEKANPHIHAMLIYGYYVTDSGLKLVRYKTSWGSSGDNTLSQWDGNVWQADLPARGFIGYHPLPQIRTLTRDGGSVRLEWAGPSSKLRNVNTGVTSATHWYVVEKASVLDPAAFTPITEPSSELSATIPDCCDQTTFFRLKLVPRPASAQ